MRVRRRFWLDERGTNIFELVIFVAVIAIITTVGAPAFVSYYRAATLKAGAQELVTIVNRGRSIAIERNTSVCVNQGNNNRVRLITGGCLGQPWTGPGTEGGGWFTLANGMRVASATTDVIFNYLGAANTTAVFTVQHPVSNATLSVTVALSGRVTIGP